MDKLPQERIDLIADEIIMNETCEGLSSYAAISKKWQRVMERCTFQEVYARANSLEFDFSLGQRVLGVESRRRALWELRLLISLPPIGLERKAIKQRHLDARQNDIVLTHAIFRALTVISTSGGNCNPFCLNLKLKAQGNLPRKKGNGLFAGDSIYHVKFNKTILGMYGGLPEATAIDSFSVRGWSYPWSLDPDNNQRTRRYLHPDAFSQLCKTLPNVATLHWAFAPPPRRHIILRRAFRSLFAKTLHGIAEDLPNLKVLHLVCEDEDPWNHHYFPINYVQPGSSGDQLSLALPRASQLPSLRKLCVQGRIAVSRQIFGSGTEEPQTWPSLEELTLSCRKQHQMGDGISPEIAPTPCLNGISQGWKLSAGCPCAGANGPTPVWGATALQWNRMTQIRLSLINSRFDRERAATFPSAGSG